MIGFKEQVWTFKLIQCISKTKIFWLKQPNGKNIVQEGSSGFWMGFFIHFPEFLYAVVGIHLGGRQAAVAK